MNKEKLKQYRALQREIPKLKRDIIKLTELLEQIPTVAGKVIKSSKEFPYTKQYATVEMQEPKRALEIRKQIAARELRLEQAEKDKTEIEEFIATIPDSTARQIFELIYLNERKMTQRRVGEMVGYDQSSVSLKINKYLKAS